MSDLIYDPASPSLHGYPIHRYDTDSIGTFLLRKARRWFVLACWRLYGRDEVVAVYMHREQSFFGLFENWLARRILNYLYVK